MQRRVQMRCADSERRNTLEARFPQGAGVGAGRVSGWWGDGPTAKDDAKARWVPWSEARGPESFSEAPDRRAFWAVAVE